MKKNIVLVGLMGAGKSTVAKYLSAKLGCEVVSTDALIERKEGRTIAEIFSLQGEKSFRTLEKDAVAEIAGCQGVIIDCGGGVVIDPANVTNLKKNGVIFYIAADPGFLYSKIKAQTQRPLLKTQDPESKLRELLAQREPYYRKADHILETTGMTIEAIGEAILKIIKEKYDRA